ncbi:phosphotransferase [Brachybacterium sp. J144]|uniref:phosphotransferase n=1 Tax=Brachybacterium sp. J144 TaxID=3116487 RepID=UPI002E77DAD2|nr:phosphotransferase [Brachybacterium sp. J144]MEE1650425.1 phosphotransferase [Brachybacterium sp. J144]
MTEPMHHGQLELSPELAAQLVTQLLPGTDPATIRLLPSSATTNTVVRIGEDLAARFPLQPTDPDAARSALAAELEAMGEFAAVSPLPAPDPVALAEPSAAFPMPWSVQTWIPGEVADPLTIAGSDAAADDLAALLLALRAVPTRGRRFRGPGRGGELTAHEDWVRECLERSRDLLPVGPLADRWERWRTLPRLSLDVMSHRDLIPANLLTAEGRVVGVLDAGGYGPADRALDLVGAWHLLDAARREQLRKRLGCSDLEWERGAAWAFVQAIGLVWYYERTNWTMAELGRSTLARLLEDPAVG